METKKAIPFSTWTSLLCVLLLFPAFGKAQTAPATGWPSYGNDPAGTRYSPARQIELGNVAQLKVAWTYRTGALPYDAELDKKAAFEASPILIDGRLFLSTPSGCDWYRKRTLAPHRESWSNLSTTIEK